MLAFQVNPTPDDILTEILVFILNFLNPNAPQSAFTAAALILSLGRYYNIFQKAYTFWTTWEAKRRAAVEKQAPAPATTNGNGEVAKLLFMAAAQVDTEISKRLDSESEQTDKEIANLRKAWQQSEWDIQERINGLQVQIGRLTEVNGRKHDEFEQRIKALEDKAA
jgi:hypothetical protein